MNGVVSEDHQGGTSDEESIDLDYRKRKLSSLKCYDADLKVIVGHGSEQEVYWHFSQTLASQSDYVDTLLSTHSPHPTPNNIDFDPSQDYIEINFVDITPSLWESMIGFLTDPFAISSMSVMDAMELSLLYDKYKFKTGIKICDDVLFKKALFDVTSHGLFEKKVYSPLELDRCVEAIALSQKINMRKTFHLGRAWISKILNGLRGSSSFPLSAKQLSQLVPTIIRDSELQCMEFTSIDDEIMYLDGDEEEIGFDLKNKIIAEIKVNYKSNVFHEIRNPMFPHFFIMMHTESCAARIARFYIPYIKLVFSDGTNVFSDGTNIHRWRYELNGDHYLYTQENQIVGTLKKCSSRQIWVAYHLNEIIFECPQSELSPIPPKTGWVVVDGSDRFLPTIEYCLRV